MLKTNTKSNQNEIQAIVNALYKKSKRSFAHLRQALVKQASHFSPIYRDFILKVINNNSLKIVNKWNDGYIVPDKEVQSVSNLNKKQKNKIYTDVRRIDTLPHELGHAVDFWFGYSKALTSNVILSNNKTLKEIFDEEFALKQTEIYKEVMSEYKAIINSNINDNAYGLLINHMSVYNELQSIKQNYKDEEVIKRRKQIQNQLYECGFVETYYQLFDKKCFRILNSKYSPILDALSSKYDFDGLFLDHHELSYYEKSKNSPVQEFFANLFEAKVTSKHVQFDNLMKFLPKSFEAFEELFSIFYEHIQQNKRFKDINIRKVIDSDEL